MNMRHYLRTLEFVGFVFFLPFVVWGIPPELQELEGEWHADKLYMEAAISRLSAAPTTATENIAYVLESWNETTILVAEDHRVSLAFNPDITLFSVDARYKTREELLNQITKGHGSFVWSYDSVHKVVNIIEKHFSTDPRWPLNQALEEEGDKQLTFNRARDLLYQKFNLYRSSQDPDIMRLPLEQKKERLLGISDDDGLVWEPSKESSHNVRDLVNALVRYAYKPGYFYHVKNTPDFDPRIGYEGLKNRTEIDWVLLCKTSRQSLESLQYIVPK